MNDLTREIDFEADGVRMVGYYAVPDGPRARCRQPGIQVSPPDPGLGRLSWAGSGRVPGGVRAASAAEAVRGFRMISIQRTLPRELA
jgi:hypothetical protein